MVLLMQYVLFESSSHYVILTLPRSEENSIYSIIINFTFSFFLPALFFFLPQHAIMTNPNKRRGGFYAFLIIPTAFFAFSGMIAYKQWEAGFWFKNKK